MRCYKRPKICMIKQNGGNGTFRDTLPEAIDFIFDFIQTTVVWSVREETCAQKEQEVREIKRVSYELRVEDKMLTQCCPSGLFYLYQFSFTMQVRKVTPFRKREYTHLLVSVAGVSW